MIDEEEILFKHGVKPTSNRILVVRALQRSSRPLNLAELESASDFTLDKSTIFRALTLFAGHGVVHAIDDGSGTVRYELCHGEEHHSVGDMHAHFHCERCGKTFCIEDVKVPYINLPEGYDLHGVNYVMTGICPDCKDREPKG